ncbi:MAG TPA: MCE family protein, partial [Acidimicrobiales bacterium]|nr:MCE family protein [Acidimicrobiales bacterium]
AAQRVIPIERTKTPFDIFELTKVGTRTIEATDTAKLNALITQLADITGDKHDELRDLFDGIAKLSGALNERDVELRSLLDRADVLSATLAEKDDTLVALIDQSKGILDLVERRQRDIGRGIDAGALTVEQVAAVVAGHKTQLDLLLGTLHPTLDILDRRRDDVDRTLAWLGAGSYGLARGPAHGPWADIYVRSLGPDVVCLLAEARGDPQLCPAS